MTLNSGKRDRAEQTYTYKCKEMQNNLIRRRVKEFRMFIETTLIRMLEVQKTAVRRSNVISLHQNLPLHELLHQFETQIISCESDFL